MFLVAITGGIACGKSSVADLFEKYEVPVISGDKIAREIVEPGKPAYFKIKEAFGDEIFLEDGTLNREALGKIIFDSVDKRRILNQITHPLIHGEIRKRVIKYFFLGHNFVALELPLLFEIGTMLDYIHKIICVSCEEDIQLARLIDRIQGLSEQDAKKRIKAQMPLEEKCKLSHFVIENSGSVKDLEEQTVKIIQMLKGSNHHWRLRGIILTAATVLLSGLAWLLNKKYKFITN